MKNGRTYYEAGQEQRLQYCDDMGPRGETEKGKTKNDVETNGGEGKERRGLEILERSADSINGPGEVGSSVKALCATRHEVDM